MPAWPRPGSLSRKSLPRSQTESAIQPGLLTTTCVTSHGSRWASPRQSDCSSASCLGGADSEVPPTMRPDSPAIDAIGAIRLLQSAGGALLDQLILHGELARVEWVEEKNRLLQMLVGAILGFACLLCIMLSAGGLLLALCWETAYRIPV